MFQDFCKTTHLPLFVPVCASFTQLSLDIGQLSKLLCLVNGPIYAYNILFLVHLSTVNKFPQLLSPCNLLHNNEINFLSLSLYKEV